MLKAGASQPWQVALERLTGNKTMSATAIRKYFQPLEDWLREQNSDAPCSWSQAQGAPNSSKKGGTAAAVVIILLLVVGAIVGIWYLKRRHEAAKQALGGYDYAMLDESADWDSNDDGVSEIRPPFVSSAPLAATSALDPFGDDSSDDDDELLTFDVKV